MKKKKVVIFLAMLFMITIQTQVLGANFNAKITANKQEIKKGEEVTVSIRLEGYEDINKGINAFHATLEYDENIFEEVKQGDFTNKNNWEEFLYNKENHQLVMIKKAGSTTPEEVLELKLKAKTEIKEGETSIRLTNMMASEGKEDIETPNIEEKMEVIKEIPDENQNDQKPDKEEPDNTVKPDEKEPEDSSATNKIPHAGVNSITIFILIAIEVFIIIAIISYRKYKKIDNKMNKIQKLFMMVITVGIITAQFTTAMYAAARKGNLNEDDSIDYKDVTLLEQHLIQAKILPDNQLSNADMNSDNKITVTDLSLLVQKIEDRLDYEVQIESTLENHYPQKGETIEYRFLANVSYDAKITEVTLNGKEYSVKKAEDTLDYVIHYEVGNVAGIQDIHITKVKLDVGKEVKVDFKDTIDVLKEIPVIKNYQVTENTKESKVKIDFEVEDTDNSITSGKIEILDKEEKAILNDVIHSGKNTIELELQDSQEYTVNLYADYNLDTDTLSEQEEDHTGTVYLSKDLKLVIDYQFSMGEISLEKNTFSKKEILPISFTSRNITKFEPEKVKVNGSYYEVEKQGEKYTFTLEAQENFGTQEIVVQEVVLNNGKVFEIKDEKVTIKIQKDVPIVSDFQMNENMETNKMAISFTLIDKDQAIHKAELVVLDENNKEISRTEIPTGKVEETISLPETPTAKYTIKVMADYQLIEDETEDSTIKEIFVYEQEANTRVEIKEVQTSKNQLEKKEEIAIFYTIQTNKKEPISKMIINSLEVPVSKEAENVYKVLIPASNIAGKMEITLSKICFKDDKEVAVNSKTEVEVLKSEPIIENYKAEDDFDKQQVKFDFTIVDSDNAFVSGKIQLVSQKDGAVKEEKVITAIGKNHYEMPVVEQEEYEFKIVVTYKRDEAGQIIEQDKLLLQEQIQMVQDYDLKISDITTKNTKKEETKYFAKKEEIRITFKATTTTKFVPEKVVINGTEYEVTKSGDTNYEVTLSGLDTSGVREFKIEKITMSNTKELEVKDNNVIRMEVLKEAPSMGEFLYEAEDAQKVKVSFNIIDKESTLTAGKIVITDGEKEIASNDNIKAGQNEISFIPNTKEQYFAKILVDYDLDTNTLESGKNEFHYVEIANKEITIVQELIELKDINSIQLYTKQGEEITEVTKVKVEGFNPKEYIAKVNMDNLPSLYTEIKEGTIKEGDFYLVLDYENAVQYDGDKKKNEIEIRFGKVIGGTAENIGLEELIQRIKEDPTGEYALTGNIDASSISVTTATIIEDFRGTLNGNGYCIKNLKKPLFNKLTSATIKNLVIENADLSRGQGILANNANNSTIENVHITNSKIAGSNPDGTGAMLGTGENGTKVEKCSITKVTVSGGKRLGGLAGWFKTNSIIDNCYVTGTIKATNDAIGGLVGQDAESITIRNSYTKIQMNMSVSNAIGGLIGYSGSKKVLLENNISLAEGTKGFRVVGTGYNGNSKNNYELAESELKTNADNKRIFVKERKDITEDFLKQTMKWDSNIWRLDTKNANNMPTLKNADPTDESNSQEENIETENGYYIPNLSRLKKMQNYDTSKLIAYHNMNRLIPFYDAKCIVEYGNKIEQSDILNTVKIKTINPFDKEGRLITGLNSDNYKSITKIRIIFENEEIKEYAVTFKRQLNQIANYQITDLDIGYNYHNYILDKKVFGLTQIEKIAKELDYKTQIAAVTAEEESRLYVDYYKESVTPKLEKVLVGLLQNQPEYNLYLNNEILLQKIEQELLQNQQLEKMLYTYNYFDKWYHFEIAGTPVTDILLLNSNNINKENSINNLIKNTINQSSDTRATKNNLKFYNTVLKPYTNKDLASFLETMIKEFAGYEDANQWFRDNFKGMLVERGIEGKENVRYQAWALLKGRSNFILPVLSTPQEDMYIIGVPSQICIGSLNRYSKHINGDSVGIKKAMENYAEKIGNFYEVSSKFIDNAEERLNSRVHIQFDTRLNFPKKGSQDTGKTQDAVIKGIYEAMEKMAPANGSGAFADGTDVFWVGYAALDGDFSFKIFSHETAHNQDSYYFYEGAGRRLNTWAEDHADANIAQDLGDGSLVFNIKQDLDVTGDNSNNLTLERISSKEDIYSYYKEMFETYYVLDYLTGQAFLRLTPEQQATVGVKATYPGKSATTYVKLTAQDFEKMNLKTMEDLWDNQIAFRNAGNVPGEGTYRGDNHYSIYWYQPHNDTGRPDSYSFKRLGFEMLGVAGYSDGYVTYRSRKSQNDLDALRKITKNDTITWKDYKMNRYETVERNLKNIKFFNSDEIIEVYKQALEKDAQNGNRNNTNNLRRLLYGIVKRATNDFTDAGIYHMSQEIPISSAQELIEKIVNNPMGCYQLVKDIDFSDIEVDSNYYVDATFLGRINGNGHAIKGVNKTVFKKLVYAQITNVIIDSPIYNTKITAIIAEESKNILLDKVKVENSNIELPFVKTIQGLMQKTGNTFVSINKSEIHTVEDLLAIEQNESGLTKKMEYQLMDNIDVSSITTGNAIISGTFSGTINGNGFSIVNQKIPLLENLTGTVTDLRIKNANIEATGISNIGTIAKTANTAIIKGIKIDQSTLKARENIGMVVGNDKNSTIDQIQITNYQLTGGHFYAGGLIGRTNNTKIKDVLVEGILTITATHNGGVVGAMNGGSLENVYAKVEIKRPSNTDARNQNGQLIGAIETNNPVIKNAVVLGNVAEDVYRIMGKDSATKGKEQITNVYELEGTTGISNVNEDNNILEATKNNIADKQFYTEKLGWSEQIWDFSKIASGIIRLF